MRAKVAVILAIIGLAIIAFAFTLTGQSKVAAIVLGLIVACAGCLIFLANERFMSEHRSFIAVISILFVILIVGYAMKLM